MRVLSFCLYLLLLLGAGFGVSRGLDSGINERAQHFLRVLIERYIRDGQPVGSRTLARDAGLDLSPATVRNVMADLEELGFVTSPHTSSGRVPTVPGYRFFVDTLISLKPLEEPEVSRAKDQLGGDGALVATDLLPDLHSYLAGGDRKIDLWFDRHALAVADFSDHPETFRNVNTPEDRVRLEQELSSRA